MNESMRLYTRNGWYHAEIQRGDRRALRTRDREAAEKVFAEMEKEWLRGRLLLLEDLKKISLGDFTVKYIASREGLSPWTVKKDELSLKLLADAIGRTTQLRALTANRLEDFKRICRARGARNVTVNGYLRHIKAALSWALAEKYIDKKPRFKMFKEDKNLPRIIDPEMIGKILGKSKEKDPELWRLFTFLLWTGCRRREALSLEWQRVRLGKAMCTLKGKGGAERIVPLLPAVVEILEPSRKDIGRVFIDYHPDTVSHKFHELALECGIDRRLHDLRHSAVTYMLASGIPIQTVAEIVGHAQLSTTMRYTHLLEDVLAREMQKFRIE